VAITVNLNGQTTAAQPGSTLFECAERLGVRVPTSCIKNGKCKECVVEVVEGGELLSAPAAAEQHLKAPFRLSCQAAIGEGEGLIRCHTMRRGQMRIERQAFDADGMAASRPLDPAVTRAGDAVLPELRRDHVDDHHRPTPSCGCHRAIGGRHSSCGLRVLALAWLARGLATQKSRSRRGVIAFPEISARDSRVPCGAEGRAIRSE